MENKYNELKKLNQLKSNGTITNAEFESQKAKILNDTTINNNSNLKKAVKILLILSIISFILLIAIGILYRYYGHKSAMLDSMEMYLQTDTYKNLEQKCQILESITKISIVITDLIFLATTICQFIKNQKNNKSIIIFVLEIITIVIIPIILWRIFEL